MSDIAIFADLHIRPARLQEFALAWLLTMKDLHNQGIQHIAIAGDVFHKFNISGRDASVGSVYHAFIDPIRHYDMECLIIDGNHDRPNNNDMSANVVLSHVPGFVVVSDKQTKTLEMVTFGGLKFACIPWMNNCTTKEKQDIISDVLAYSPDMVLGHLEIDGIKLPNNYQLFGTKFNFPMDQIDFIRDKCHVLLGHVHNKSDYYLGSFNQINFGDEGLDVGYHIYRGSTCSLEFIRNDYSPKYVNVDVLSPEDYQLKFIHNRLNLHVKYKFHFKVTDDIIKTITDEIVEEVIEDKRVNRMEVDGTKLSLTELLAYYLTQKGIDKGMQARCMVKLDEVML